MLIILTGCLGFIGRTVTNRLLLEGHWIYGVDSQTYAADSFALAEFYKAADEGAGNFKFVHEDISNLIHIPDADVILNFAAETNVDNSIVDPGRFVHSNVVGVHNLLELARAKRHYEIPRFIQISTDEVYGDTIIGSVSKETDILDPSNPYSATKASAEHSVRAYARTHKIPYNILRLSNCYGPHQYPEKLIPKVVRHLGTGKPIPIHKDGSQIRTWVYVNNVASAVSHVIDRCDINETYNVGGESTSVNDIVRGLIECATVTPNPDWKSYCKFAYERNGIDMHYRLDDTKLRQAGWAPSHHLAEELPKLYEHFRRSARF